MMISSMAKSSDSKEVFKKRVKIRIIYSCLLVIPGIILAIMGLTLGVTAEHSGSFINGYLCGVGFGFIGAGVATAIKTSLIYKNPDKLKALYIRETDERSIYIGNRAVVAAFYTVVALLFIASVVIGFINISSVVFLTLFTVMVGMVLIAVIYYSIFNRKI